LLHPRSLISAVAGCLSVVNTSAPANTLFFCSVRVSGIAQEQAWLGESPQVEGAFRCLF